MVNTRALILRRKLESSCFLHVYDGWLSATSLEGFWSLATNMPPGIEPVANKLVERRLVDPLSGCNARPSPSLANGVPAIYVREKPADFSRIPPSSPAGFVLACVAGTPQAREAVIANSIPQTATVPRAGGPIFAAVYDGEPELRPIEGTSLEYVINSPTPIIRVDSHTSGDIGEKASGCYTNYRTGTTSAAAAGSGVE